MLPIARKRLHLILQDNGSITKPEDELDKIYSTVLENSANHDYDEEEKEWVYGMLREILGTIVCLFSPLSADSLATLIKFPSLAQAQTCSSTKMYVERRNICVKETVFQRIFYFLAVFVSFPLFIF